MILVHSYCIGIRFSFLIMDITLTGLVCYWLYIIQRSCCWDTLFLEPRSNYLLIFPVLCHRSCSAAASRDRCRRPDYTGQTDVSLAYSRMWD